VRPLGSGSIKDVLQKLRMVQSICLPKKKKEKSCELINMNHSRGILVLLNSDLFNCIWSQFVLVIFYKAFYYK
jgi:hypothetical protein